MTKLCQNCCKQYTCKTTGQDQCESKCINFKSWIYTKNYGEVKYADTRDTQK